MLRGERWVKSVFAIGVFMAFFNGVKFIQIPGDKPVINPWVSMLVLIVLGGFSVNYWAVLPPSTAKDAPVIKGAFSDERNTMVCAISAGLPVRLSGTPPTKPAFLSLVPVNRFSIPVSIGPGATTLTRTPDPAASSAADLVNPSTACLLAT